MRSLLPSVLTLSLLATGTARATLAAPAPEAEPPEDVWQQAFGDQPPEVKTPDAPGDDPILRPSFDGGLVLIPRMRFHRARPTRPGIAGALRIGFLVQPVADTEFFGGLGLELGGGGYTDQAHELYAGLTIPLVFGPVVFRFLGGIIANDEDVWTYVGAELGYRLDLFEFGIQIRATSEGGEKVCTTDSQGDETCEQKVTEPDGSQRDPRTQAWGPGLYVGIHF